MHTARDSDHASAWHAARERASHAADRGDGPAPGRIIGSRACPRVFQCCRSRNAKPSSPRAPLLERPFTGTRLRALLDPICHRRTLCSLVKTGEAGSRGWQERSSDPPTETRLLTAPRPEFRAPRQGRRTRISKSRSRKASFFGSSGAHRWNASRSVTSRVASRPLEGTRSSAPSRAHVLTRRIRANGVGAWRSDGMREASSRRTARANTPTIIRRKPPKRFEAA